MPFDFAKERHGWTQESTDREVQSACGDHVREEMCTAAHLGEAEKCAEDSNAYQGDAGNFGPAVPQGKIDREK